MSRKALRYIEQTLIIIAVAGLLGLVGGFVTVLFIKCLGWIQQFIWTTLPDRLQLDNKHAFYTVTICTIGGLLVGLGSKYLGNYPKNLQTELASFKTTKEFDYKHVPQAIINSLLSLGFGAALGPEAALTSIVGGMGTWISKKLSFLSTGTVETLSLSTAFGAVFGSPIGSAAVATQEKGTFATKLQLFIGGLVAAGAAFWVFFLSSGAGGYLNLDTLPYTFDSIDVVKAVVPAFAGVVAAAIFIRLLERMKQIMNGVAGHLPIIAGAIGGLVLGCLGALWPLVLFSGHEGLHSLMGPYATASAGLLIVIALAKTLAATSLLASGWKGGQFFPVMFIGAAVGLGITQLVPTIPAMVGIVAGMTAMLAWVLKKPVAAGVLVLFFFPPSLYPSILASALLVNLLMQLIRKRTAVS